MPRHQPRRPFPRRQRQLPPPERLEPRLALAADDSWPPIGPAGSGSDHAGPTVTVRTDAGDWTNAFVLKGGGGALSPTLRVAFDPQPEPPGGSVLAQDRATRHTLTTATAASSFRGVVSLQHPAGLTAKSTWKIESTRGEMNLVARNAIDKVVCRVELTVRDAATGKQSPAIILGFDPQPEPPGEAGVVRLGFTATFPTATRATLTAVVKNPANAPVIMSRETAAPLIAGATVPLSFKLSAPSTTFGSDDVFVTGGTLSNFSGYGTDYQAVFTPTADSTTPARIEIPAGVFTDASDHPNLAGGLIRRFAVDTVRPTLSITTPSGVWTNSVLLQGDGAFSPLVRVGFDPQPEPPGETTISLADPQRPTLTIAESAGRSVRAVVALGAPGLRLVGGVYRTMDQTTGRIEATLQDAQGIDRFNLTLTIRTPTGAAADIASWTFFDPQPEPPGLPADSFSVGLDIAFGPTAAGAVILSADVGEVDGGTLWLTRLDERPVGNKKSVPITFLFNEPVVGFSLDDLVVEGGRLVNLRGRGDRYTARFVPTGDSTSPGRIDLRANSVFDRFGNPALEGGLRRPIAVDTQSAFVTQVTAVAPQQTTRIDFEVHFSEPVSFKGRPPTFSFLIGDRTRRATYRRGSDTETLVFSYDNAAGRITAEQIAELETGTAWQNHARLIIRGLLTDAGGNSVSPVFD